MLVVCKGVLDSVGFHQCEACTVRKAVSLILASLKDPPSFRLVGLLDPENPYSRRSLEVPTKRDSHFRTAPILQER